MLAFLHDHLIIIQNCSLVTQVSCKTLFGSVFLYQLWFYFEMHT